MKVEQIQNQSEKIVFLGKTFFGRDIAFTFNKKSNILVKDNLLIIDSKKFKFADELFYKVTTMIGIRSIFNEKV